MKIELLSILSILYFVERKFYNFNLLNNCDTVDFYETELLNFNFNQPEWTQNLYYKPELRFSPFQHCFYSFLTKFATEIPGASKNN